MKIDPKRLREHRFEASSLLAHFTVPYLREAYRQLDGDLVMLVVLGEIATRNIGALFAVPGKSPPKETRDDLHEPERRLRPCNALSVSDATGIPRETVRRKVAALVERGWLQRTPRGHLFLTTQVAKRFESFTNDRIVSLLESAEALAALLDVELGQGRTRSRNG